MKRGPGLVWKELPKEDVNFFVFSKTSTRYFTELDVDGTLHVHLSRSMRNLT